MDIKKLLKNYAKRINAQNLSGNVSIINEQRFAKLLTKEVEKEIERYSREKTNLQAEVNRLNGIIEGMSQSPQKSEIDFSSVIDSLNTKIDDLKHDLKDEIRKQVSAAAVTSEDAKASIVDMQSFLDRLFEGDDLETNIEVVKQKKIKIDKSSLEKLREMKGR